jgi:3-deoxy-D-arabino-heptulosonate 7-phosphate (DAHP) synthase class II
MTFKRSMRRDNIYHGGRNAENVPKPLHDLACGAERQVRSYRGCIVNGARFHTQECAQNRTT